MITISNDKTLKMWDELTLNLLYTYTDSCALKIAIQINQTQFLVANDCQRFKLLKFFIDSTKTTANVTNSFQFTSSPMSLALFDKSTLILGSSNGTIQIFDLNSDPSTGYKQILDEKSTVFCLSVIDQNLFASGLMNRFISIWNLTNQTKLKSLNHGHSVYSLILTNDRKYLVSGDLYFKISYWKTNSWTFEKSIYCASFKMVQLNDDFIAHISFSSIANIPIGMYLSTIKNSTFRNITSNNYYSLTKLDNDLIAFGSTNGNQIDSWQLNDPINPRIVKSKQKPHTNTITDTKAVKGFFKCQILI